jgi:hypothetical protein
MKRYSDFFKKYNQLLPGFIMHLSYNLQGIYKKDYEQFSTKEHECYASRCLDFIKYIIETHNMDLFDICKVVYDKRSYALRGSGLKTIQDLYLCMQDKYNITISQYTPEELYKLLKKYMNQPVTFPNVNNIERTYHVSFDVTISVKDTANISKIFEERIQNSINRFCGIQSNIKIQEIL